MSQNISPELEARIHKEFDDHSLRSKVFGDYIIFHLKLPRDENAEVSLTPFRKLLGESNVTCVK